MGEVKTQSRDVKERALDEQIIKSFSKLFPTMRPKDMLDPARAAMMAAISNMGIYAFGAYDSPSCTGFKEETLMDTDIYHLSKQVTSFWSPLPVVLRDHLKNSMEGALKIHLHSARNLYDSDVLYKGDSDPYVVFSCGGSQVKSKTIDNNNNPDWNSIHYIFVRKRSILPGTDTKLKIAVFDNDTRETPLYRVANAVDKDDNLGSIVMDVNTLKKPGVQKYNEALIHPRTKHKSSIQFDVEWLTVDAACKALGLGPECWDESTPFIPSEFRWPDLCNMTAVGKVTVDPAVYIDAKASGSQGWIYSSKKEKVVVVAFRGTEAEKLKDVLTDAKFLPSRLSAASRSDLYIMKPTEAYLQEGILVHRGFRQAYDTIREAVLRVVYDITEWSHEWTVCVTGHSLGGALATLAAFELSNRKLPPAKGSFWKALESMGWMQGGESEPLNPKVGMMNFGAPRVGNTLFADVYNESVTTSVRVVNETDLVHLLPPFYYQHIKYEVVVMPDGDVNLAGLRLLDSLNPTEPGAEEDESEIVERAFSGPSVTSHLQPYYFSIVKEAVTKFFHNDMYIRKRPLRVTRAFNLKKSEKE